MAADRAIMLSRLDALAKVASDGRSGQPSDIRCRSERAAGSGKSFDSPRKSKLIELRHGTCSIWSEQPCRRGAGHVSTQKPQRLGSRGTISEYVTFLLGLESCLTRCLIVDCSAGSATLVEGSEFGGEIGQHVMNEQAVGRNVMAEAIPPGMFLAQRRCQSPDLGAVDAMIAAVGSAYASAAHLLGFPSTIDDKDLKEEQALASHSK
jgi:hypothetical protein